MTRKHNTKHARSRGRYKQRLAKRGLTRTPRMPSLLELRKRVKREDDSFIREAEVLEDNGKAR